MTPKRPHTLSWIGDRLPDGRPERYLDFVPDRDLTPEETDRLSQEQLTIIRHSGLYREHEAPKAKKRPPAESAEPEPFPVNEDQSEAASSAPADEE